MKAKQIRHTNKPRIDTQTFNRLMKVRRLLKKQADHQETVPNPA